MNATRREFVRLGLGSCTLLACGTTVPGFLARSAMAAPQGDRSTGRVLVVLELVGGNDGLNTVVPYADDAYHRHRPRLKIPAGSLHKLDDHVGLHPGLGGLNDLWTEGELAIVQSVGYPNPNRSHFESEAIWYTGMLEPDANAAGWLNRGVGPRRGGLRRGRLGHPRRRRRAPGRPARRRPLRPFSGRARPARAATGHARARRHPGPPRRPRPRREPSPRRAGLALAVHPAQPGRHLCQQRTDRADPPSRHEPNLPRTTPIPGLRSPAPARIAAHPVGALDLGLLRSARGIRYALLPAWRPCRAPLEVRRRRLGVLRGPPPLA